MKKLLTLLSTAALACSLAMPVFARAKSSPKAQGTTAVHKTRKAHRKHARKHGATKGKKMGQQGTTPGQTLKR